MRRDLSILLLVLAGVACGPNSPDAGNGRDARPGGNEFIDAGPVMGCTQMDFVFVIDDSA